MKRKNKPNGRSCNFILAAMAAIIISALCSCTKYLDAKPDKSLQIPSSLADYQALLDDENLSALYPAAVDNAADYFYVTAAKYNAVSDFVGRENYIWDPGVSNDIDWLYMYSNILVANTVLAGVERLPSAGNGAAAINQVKGSAYFFRAYCYNALSTEFTQPYSKALSTQASSGLPLHLKADITAPTIRSTMEQTYEQIISDFNTALPLLPDHPLVKSRPCRAAVYGALARVYLTMGDYVQAGRYADSCLKRYSTLIDYNTISPSANTPFPRFGDEVIFHSASSGRGGVLSPSKEAVDTLLYRSYGAGDLRKLVFFKPNSTGQQVFKGDYGGSGFSDLFGGIATDEMYLIRAECYARAGNIAAALQDLNTLLAARYQTGTFTPYQATSLSADQALALIISERRKELCYRNELRWADLKRLNSDSRFAITLTRNLAGTTYTLAPGDKRYTFLIPISVVQITGIPQNER